MRIHVLAFEGCPNDQPTIARIREVLAELALAAEVERIEVTPDTCAQLRFLGSPTVQIDGLDIEPAARDRTAFAMSCRTYPGSGGVPARSMILNALREASAKA